MAGQSQLGALYNESRNWAAVKSIMRHLSDHVQLLCRMIPCGRPMPAWFPTVRATNGLRQTISCATCLIPSTAFGTACRPLAPSAAQCCGGRLHSRMEDSKGVWVSTDVFSQSWYVTAVYAVSAVKGIRMLSTDVHCCTSSVTCRNALLMNALSTPSHLPSRQQSSGRNASVAEIQAEEEQRSARQNMFNQQV